MMVLPAAGVSGPGISEAAAASDDVSGAGISEAAATSNDV